MIDKLKKLYILYKIYRLKKLYNRFYKIAKLNLSSVYGKTVTDFYADTDSFKEKGND